MTVQEAFEQFLNSPEFANTAKQKDSAGSKYRVMKLRYNRDKLDYLAMIRVLIDQGYKIEVKRK